MLRKELFDKYIPVDDYIKYRFPLEDWPTWLILSKYTKLGYLPISTATYRYGHESISNPKRYEHIQKRFKAEQFMYKYLCDMFPEDLLYDKKGYEIYVTGILLNLAIQKFDFQAASKYSIKLKALGANRIKVKVSQFRISFYMFALIKSIKKKLSE